MLSANVGGGVLKNGQYVRERYHSQVQMEDVVAKNCLTRWT